MALLVAGGAGTTACQSGRTSAPPPESAATTLPGPPPSHAPASTPTTPTTAGPPTSSVLCGFRSGVPAVTKVMVIWEENKDYGDIIGSPQAPTLNSVAARCGLATDAQAVTHPSLPNYLSETSGESYAYPPFDGDCSPGGSCSAGAPSVFAQLVSAGKQWRAYNEDMPSTCDPSGSGLYAPRHNPAVYYPGVAAQCAVWDVPLGTLSSGPLVDAARAGGLPALSTVTPDLIDDMHDGTVADGDSWLRQWLPVLTAGPDYRSGRLAIIIAWDEGAGGGNEASHIPVLVLSAYTAPGTRSAVPYDNYSVLATFEDLTGVPRLGLAAQATSLVRDFHL